MGTAKEKSGKGKNMIVLSRSYAFLLSGFILFLFFWMFVLGVFVGKGIIPGSMFDIKYPINRVRALLGLKEKIKYEPPKEGSLDFYADLENKKNRAKIKNLITAEDKIPDQQITLARDEKGPQPDKGNEVRGLIGNREREDDDSLRAQDDIMQTSSSDGQKEQSYSSLSKEAPPSIKVEAGEHYSVQIAAISDLAKAEETLKILLIVDMCILYGLCIGNKDLSHNERQLCYRAMRFNTNYDSKMNRLYWFISKVDGKMIRRHIK
jgi:hypothetical protein